jgi:hypothetical protein
MHWTRVRKNRLKETLFSEEEFNFMADADLHREIAHIAVPVVLEMIV